jgi:hypothetical protein
LDLSENQLVEVQGLDKLTSLRLLNLFGNPQLNHQSVFNSLSKIYSLWEVWLATNKFQVNCFSNQNQFNNNMIVWFSPVITTNAIQRVSIVDGFLFLFLFLFFFIFIFIFKRAKNYLLQISRIHSLISILLSPIAITHFTG